VLLLHQRAKHFRCGSCAKQFANVGTMKTHALKAHGETVAKARVGAAAVWGCGGVRERKRAAK
jgi:hypothetical protein